MRIRFIPEDKFDIDARCDQVTVSELCIEGFSDLQELAASYNSTLAGLLDTHVPMMTKTVAILTYCIKIEL